MLGSGIKIVRNKRKFTQAQLSKEIGTTQSYLSLLESNAYYPSKDMLDKICEALNVDAMLLYWYGIDESSIPENKIDAFRTFNKRINDLLEEVFDRTI